MRWSIDRNVVTVLMFHSIGDRNDSWIWASMTERAEVFESLLVRLAASGYETIGLDELYSYMAGKSYPPGNKIVLTFDDGYLDNWVIAAPILRKYGMKGVVYISPEFVQPAGSTRPTLEDVEEGRLRQQDLQTIGFMNWDELRELDEAGTLEVQSHALTHTWYFSEGVVNDIHRPRTVFPYPWLSWNARPDRKPWYLEEDQQRYVPWGLPVLKHEKSLVARRFLPDTSFVEEITAYVTEKGRADFFSRPDWQQSLDSRFGLFNGRSNVPGNAETEAEYLARVEFELKESKSILERELSRPVEYLSWPGGGVNDKAARIAVAVGYKSWTMSSWQDRRKRNKPGTDPRAIKRVSGRSKVHWKSKWIAEGGSWWVMQRVLQHQGSVRSFILTAVRKLIWVFEYYLRGRNKTVTH